MSWKITILTIFPEMFPGFLGQSIAGKALEQGKWEIEVVNIRDFARDKHKKVDDKIFGGGVGLLMKPDVIGEAIEAHNNGDLLYMSPRGERFNQQIAKELIKKDITILCGRYEGVDERIFLKYNPRQISLGDFILSGGEVAAFAVIDACIRLIPGILPKEEAVAFESFEAGLLEYPQYTKPMNWQGYLVPEILVSGNHQKIEQWRKEQSLELTRQKRPDLIKQDL